jgi:hypothetical protein
MPGLIARFSSRKGSRVSIQVMFLRTTRWRDFAARNGYRNPDDREFDCLESIDAGFGKL